MAQVAEYEVLHPVRHDGHLHPRGATIKLTTSAGSRLVKMLAVRPFAGALPVEVEDETVIDRGEFLANIQTAKKDALYQFAQVHYGLKATGTKDEMVAAILNAEAALTLTETK